MSIFNFDLLMEDIKTKTGYKLYRDFGEIMDDDIPYRRVNTIVTPVVGIFRLNPVPLTALTTPYIAVVSASIEIPAPTEKAEEVRDKLNEVAGLFNATTNRMDTKDSSFTVVYSFETCVVGDKRRDVGIYNGEIVEISQSVTFTIIERGITALDTELKINGLSVPFLRLEETRVSTSETTPNPEGHGEMAVTQEMYGITFDTPLIDNRLGEMLMDAVNNGSGNKAYAVEIIRNGKSSVYLMGIGTAAASANPPANIGVTISMAEINPMAARYSDLWTVETKEGASATITMANDGIVVWGDGTISHGAGFKVHVYTDGLASHEVYIFNYNDESRFAVISEGVSLFRKKIRPKVDSGSLPTTEIPKDKTKDDDGNINIIVMNTGDRMYLTSSGVLMVDVGVNFSISRQMEILDNVHNYFDQEVTCNMRGTVKTINTELIEYDRWAVSEEV